MAAKGLCGNGIGTGLTLLRTVVGLGDVSPDALPQGDSPWLAPSTYVMRQAPRKGSGPGAHFMGTL